MTDIVTAFLSHRGELLLVQRGDDVGTYRGLWGGVSGYVGDETDDPLADARRELREEVAVEDAALVRAGDPLDVVDEEHDRAWTVHPFLFDAPDRRVELNRDLVAGEWVAPGAVFDRECVSRLWETYRRVGPTVEAVAEDESRGSAAISVTALEALRDAATEAARADAVDAPAVRDWDGVRDEARDLRDARPSMVAVANRVNRVMAECDDAPAVADRAHEELRTALDADGQAASEAAAVLADATGDGTPTVCTISRSGTVLAALREADAAVVVGESRTGNEGVAVAEELAAEGREVTLTTDAALPSVVAGAVGPEPDAVLVGADAVLPDGRVVNKVGTRSLGLACRREEVPCYVVATRDKVAGESVAWGEAADSAALADDAAVTVENPVFDATPSDCVTVLVTERGVLYEDAFAAVVDEHREQATWDGA